MDLNEKQTKPTNQCNITNFGDMTGKTSLDILRLIFHHDNFRGKQEEAIDSISQGQNTVLVMPTGSGKSLLCSSCFNGA